MKLIVWVILLFTVAVVAATALGGNDGLVSIYWQGWRADLSLNLFLLLFLGCSGLIVALVLAARGLVGLPGRARRWREQRRERAAQQALREALAEYFSARYGRARKAAERALDLQPDTPALQGDLDFRLLAQLLVAGSLHRLQDRSRRDAVLAEAHAAARKGSALQPADDAVRMLAAEWALEDRDPERAQELLAALPPGAARRTQALRLKLQAARLARQPLQALHMARLLAKHQAFSPLVAQSLLRSLASEALETAHDPQQLQRLWTEFDAAERRDPQLAARAASRAAQLQAFEDARAWLLPFWERLGELSPEDREAIALALVAACPGMPPDWLPRLESAAQTYGQEPAVLAAVGHAYAQRQLWGKARQMLEQAAASANLPGRARRGAWRELAALARHEGDEARAAGYERAAALID